MSAEKFIPNPKAVSCAEKVGLPSWYTQDPMLMKPEVALDPKREKAFNDCMMSKNNTKEPIYYILVTAGVLIAGYFAYKKFKK